MGAGTFLAERAEQTTPRVVRRRGVDLPFLLAVFGLLVFGLVMLFSASWDFSIIVLKEAPTYMFTRQLVWLGIGLSLAVGLSFVDYHQWRRFILPIMLITIAMLIGVLFVNEIILGAKRSLLSGSIQPSELAKLVTVMYLSVWLYAKRQNLHDVGFGLLPLSVIMGVLGGLIVLQPDISAAATVFIMGGVLFFLAGGDLKQIAVLLLIAAFVGWVIVQLSATGQQRIHEFVNGILDPKSASYHVLRAFEAIVNGGVFGVGIGKSLAKVTGLPVPPTDSIFAVVAEELGLLGVVILMGMYALLIWRGFVIARRAPDMLGTLLATGLVTWIGVEALINMAVMVGLMPFAGNALPFVSAGGSNLTAVLAAVGILTNISRQQGVALPEDEDRRMYSAAVDLRRRNGRRSVSRARRA